MALDSKYKGVAELLGMAAVIGSLIFVGLEVRQNASATRGATQQQLSSAARELTLTLAEPGVAELFIRGNELNGWVGLSDVEQRRLTLMMLASLRVYEDAYYQFRIGNLDSDLWRGWEAGLSVSVNQNSLREFWPQRRHRFLDDFQVLVDSLIAAS